ncbi:MAG TPA: hypothetical protein VN519_15160 [Bryobacteraceae bacterium]|nr:hypothetical protein [Bryobacteraceae bacterium]
MENRRYLCSQLATLTIDGQAQWVNIEEICETGVILECETPVAAGGAAGLTAGDAAFEGRITDVRQDEFGWRVEMEFSPETPWVPLEWRPDHLLDPAVLKQN